MTRIQIGGHWVGDGEPVYLVAEAGSNHNGNFEQALRLIDVAAEAGVNAVKFQHFKAATLYPRFAGESDYLKTSRPIYDIIKEMETPDEWVPRLADYCRMKRLAFLSSPFDEASADLLDPYVPAFKIASYEMTHAPLLRHIARKRKPMIISTGTASLVEVMQAVEVIRLEGNERIIVLQCTAKYPTPLEAVNARALVSLRDATGLPTGLSDHSRDPILAPVVAVALGACLIEKHVTLDNRMPGPDHAFAIEPHELKMLVQRVRDAERALGHGRKEPLPEEQELRAFARRSIFAIRDIWVGEQLNHDNVAVLRCGKLGFGLAPDSLEKVIGRTAAKLILAEALIRMEDLE
ncbi:MAG: N-acetylneuraminate synthase family protein [Nitrospirota bacterium]|nr:N-acetylneuraminate synthase family protein [Nitrospirota bacterium]MDP3515167.1 N-acetylneuraminate synthase family protein [Sulfuritalea sp.]